MDNQQKLQSYQLLIEMVKRTTSTMESDSILQFILDGFISVLPSVDVGVLFLYEEDKDLLKMVATHNIQFDDDYPYLKPGESVSGKCFMNRDCIALNTTEVFVNYMDSFSTYMKSFPDANIKYPYSAMVCCLIADGQAVGVVIVYNYTDPDYVFTVDDLELLHAAADHAAITISKSQLIKQKDYYLQQLEESNRALESTVEIQSRFTDIILNSSGFPTILEYLKTVINGEVALFDVFFQEIYATDRDHEITLQQLIDDNDLLKMAEKQYFETIHYQHHEQLVIINPVIVQKNLIGFLIVILHGQVLNKKDEAVLNHAALVIAQEWLKNDAITKSFSDFSNKFLDLVLKTPIDLVAVNYAKQLGFNKDGDFCVMVIKGDAKTEDRKNQDEVLKSLVLKNVINTVKASGLRGIVFPRGNDIYIIFSGIGSNHRMIQQLGRVEERIMLLDHQKKIIRGGIYHSLNNIKKSYQDTELCLKMIADFDIFPRKIEYDALGIWQLLLKLDKKDLEEYAGKILKNLLAEKPDKQREFLITLQTYAAHNQNIKETAHALNLHHNTIYFRVKKLEELLDLDFNNQKDWLSIQLACTIFGKCNNSDGQKPNAAQQ